ncbi:MAG: hypothetical protein AAF724_18205 [Pseudomonadota bacterium]
MAEPQGLMAFWADFEDDVIHEIRRWHNCEHMLERVSLPGFLRGRRYRGNGTAATFLMYYETDTAEVLGSAPYRAALDAPSDWTRRALPHFTNPARNIYALAASAGNSPPSPAPFLTTLRFNADLDGVEDRYRGSVLPALAARDNVLRARLWRIDEAISGIQTSERRIYGGGPGEQAFLLFVEMHAEIDPILPATLPGLSDTERDFHRDTFAETGWLDFALEAPDDH